MEGTLFGWYFRSSNVGEKLFDFKSSLMLVFDFAFLFRFIYEAERHNGIAELLEILGRLVNIQHYPGYVHSIFKVFLFNHF